MLDAEITLTGIEGFVDGARPESNRDALARGSKSFIFSGEDELVQWGGISAANFSPLATNPTGYDSYAYLMGGFPCVVTKKGLGAYYRNSLKVFSGDPAGVIDWGQGAKTLSYTPQLSDGTTTGVLGLPVPPPLNEITSGTPVAGEFKIVSGAGNKLKKSVSLRTTTYRVETRGESWASEDSDLVLPTPSMGAIQLRTHALPAGTYPGTIKMRLYSTPQGFGLTESHQRVSIVGELDPDTLYTISWNDTDLGASAPYSSEIDTWATPTSHPGKYGLPPLAKFTTVLGAHVLCIGCYTPPDTTFSTAHFLHPSQAFKMENFDPDTPVALPAAEAVQGVLEAQNDGFLLIVQDNAITALVLSGSASFPVIPRLLYYGIGAFSASQVCVVSGEIYVFSKQKGFVRSGGGNTVESSFTRKVRKFLSGFTNPVVEYDPATDRVLVGGLHADPFGAGPAACFIGYERGLEGDRWTAPMPLSATPIVRIAYDNDAYFGNTGGFVKLFGGTTAEQAIAQFHPQDGGAKGRRKSVTRFDVFTSAATCDVGVCAGRTPAVVTNHVAINISYEGHSGWVETSMNLKENFCSKITLPAGGSPKEFDSITMQYQIEDGYA